MLAKKPRPWRINLILELTRNGWVKIRDKIIENFGKTCKDLEYRTTIDLLDNIVPATLDIYANLFRAGLFDEYVET
ncbi:27238_t:CDS:1, partial [Racocetra persica]